MTIRFQRSLLRWPRLAVVCTLVWGACMAPAMATQTVAIGEVAVSSSGDAAFAEAMRSVLIRATGRRSAANDPAFAPLLQDARRYVQILRPPTAGNPARITLDAAAVERAIAALGQTVWARQRPLVLLVVTQPPPGADAATVREQLERAASERGLPLRLSSAAAAGLTPGSVVSAEAALLAARRAGADVALIGEADGAEWQWSLVDGAAVTVFTGEVTAGVEGAADALALGSLATLAQPFAETELRVVGVESLKDYADVQRILEANAAIKAAALVAAEGDAMLFRVEVAGGAAGLVSALANQSRLRREGGRNEPPRFRFTP